jgi:branched-subunit amino acid transport protein
MKLLFALAAILTALWLPIAFMQAMQLQSHIDARIAGVARLARASP